MRIAGRAEIRAALDEDEVLAALRAAFIDYAAGRAQVAAVGHLAFQDPPGDCHIKSAHVDGAAMFVVKVASTFSRNSESGLSTSQGAMLLADATTGEVTGVLDDGGYLTDVRTALAGVLAAEAIQRPGARRLGLVGTGIQARMQAERIRDRLDYTEILVWGRNPARASDLARELGARSVDLPSLCSGSDLIVTTTSSHDPLIQADWIARGARIVAVGADSPGKQELATAILTRARVVVDSPAQCLAHGEAGWAARAGLLREEQLIPLGRLLAEPVVFASEEIVVADLTGVAVQDSAIAMSVWRRLAPTGVEVRPTR